jgi:CBS domain-containing protein
MSIETLVQRPVGKLGPTATCAEGAQMMRDQNIGAVVVARDDAPLGIVTDRDLAVRIIAEGRNAKEVTLEEVMSPYPAFLTRHRTVDQALMTMRELGVRRLPVVDDLGRLDGMLSLDDVLMEMSRRMSDISEAIRVELSRDAPS